MDDYFFASHSETSCDVDNRPLLNINMTGNAAGSTWFDIDRAVCLERCPVAETSEETVERRSTEASSERPSKKPRIPKKLMNFEDTLAYM